MSGELFVHLQESEDDGASDDGGVFLTRDAEGTGEPGVYLSGAYAVAPELLEALKGMVDVAPCQNDCAPGDLNCATRKAEVAIANSVALIDTRLDCPDCGLKWEANSACNEGVDDPCPDCGVHA